jgi:hypothetical protein
MISDEETRRSFGNLVSRYGLVSSIYKRQPYAYEECSVDYGWHRLMGETFERLIKLGWTGRIVSIKEKWGGLRMYLDDITTQEMMQTITEAEYKSHDICERCGRTQRVTTESSPNKSWIKTLCDFCRYFGRG